MIVVDSSVWIDSLRRSETSQVALLRGLNVGQLIVGDLIALETLRGIDGERRAAAQEQRFRAIGITVLSNPEIVVAAAKTYRTLRSLGVTIRSSVDLVIATFCLTYGHTLLHSDRDFDHFERHFGLRVLR